MSAIQIMNEDEIQRAESISSESGFGCVQTALGNLPVKGLDLKTKITGLVYETTVRQTYVNRYNRPLEATYIFPLPDRGAVGDFKMIVGGREIDGVLKERGQARREYQQAIESGHRASIVEEERPDTFSMRVGNVEAGEEITIEFKVTGPLIFADGEATFRFPLVVAPRYIPGTPLEGGNVGDGTASDTDAVPDASRITPPVLLPGFPSPVALSIECELVGGDLAVSNVRSSLHAVTVSQGNGIHHIAIQPGEKVNRDFILRFDVGQDDVQSAATYTKDADGQGGTFMLTLVPPKTAQGEELPRDIVFVLDRSGSMGGWKMVAARRALGRMLDTLTPKDRFQIIVFDNASTKFGHELVEGNNRNRYRAIEDLSKVEARGGTEMAMPIFEGLDMLSGGYQDRRRMLVLVTDGQVGNEQQIIAGVQQRQKNVNIHTVGIDQAVNAGFLNRLADIGGGRCELVESEDRLDDAMGRIHRTIGTPVLTEMALAFDGVTPLSNMFAPERMPDLFVGSPVQVFGRYKGNGTPVVNVTAANRDGSKWETTLKARETGDRATTAIWARQKVRSMEDQYAKSPSGGLTTEITNLSLRFGVLCRFTSWVAVDKEQTIATPGDVHSVVQPVEQPAGWGQSQASYASNSFAAPAAPAPMRGGPTGSGFSSGGFGGQPPGAASPPPPMQAPRMAQEEQTRSMSWDSMSAADAEMDDADDSLFSAYEAPARKQKRERRPEGAQMTQAGALPPLSTILSPEQARGEQIDVRTDVFRLGVVAFQMLTGRKLFNAINHFDLLQSVVTFDPVILEREPTITGHWLAVLSKALQPDPANRHASPRELLQDLEGRFGEITAAQVSWPHAGDQPLAGLVGTLDDAQKLWVFAWLCAAVGHMEDATGAAIGTFTIHDVNVKGGTGKAHVIGHNGPGFFEKIKRWLGFAESSRSEDFWK